MIIEHIKSKEFAIKIIEILNRDYKPPRKPRKPPGISTRKPRYWFNNGIKNVYQVECPEGFVAGYLHKRK